MNERPTLEVSILCSRVCIEDVFRSLHGWVRERDWRGFDPYDGLNSRLVQRIPIVRSKWGRIAVIQFCKHSPLNPRSLLGIAPGLNPKAVALFLSGTVRAYRVLECPDLEQDIVELGCLLVESQSEGGSGVGWGYDFPWQSRAFYLPAYTPTIVATSYAGNALLDAYELIGRAAYLSTARSAGRFILTGLNRTYDDDGEAFCFSYSPLDETRVYNATLLGSRLLARLYEITEEEELRDAARASVEYVVRRQQRDGAWIYGESSSQQWIDNFHTGFILECLEDYIRYADDRDPRYIEALKRGREFYVDRLFEDSGAPRYYAHQLYPIDIHCCAQAVITGMKAADWDEGRELARRVLPWTLRHMRDGEGYFYFQKRRFYTHKVPFMRWSQAWMYLALSVALQSDDNSQRRGSRHRDALHGSEHARENHGDRKP